MKTHDITAEEILALITKRSQVLSLGTDYFARNTPPQELSNSAPQEVYKDAKMQRCKYNSYEARMSEVLATPSDGGETKAQRAVANLAGSNIAPPQELSNCGITGISAQHCKTEHGVKLFLNIQTHEQSLTADVTALTAELKRLDRLRQLKINQNDSYEFEQNIYLSTINEFKQWNEELSPERKKFCMGRLHVRGARAAWIPDAMVVGKFNDEDHLEYIILHIDNKEYEINLTDEVSPRQAQYYHTAGHWGKLQTSKPVKTWDQLPWRRI